MLFANHTRPPDRVTSFLSARERKTMTMPCPRNYCLSDVVMDLPSAFVCSLVEDLPVVVINLPVVYSSVENPGSLPQFSNPVKTRSLSPVSPSHHRQPAISQPGPPPQARFARVEPKLSRPTSQNYCRNAD